MRHQKLTNCTTWGGIFSFNFSVLAEGYVCEECPQYSGGVDPETGQCRTTTGESFGLLAISNVTSPDVISHNIATCAIVDDDDDDVGECYFQTISDWTKMTP